jgi:UDP-N-acetylmuramoyl-L-alanyl-D-glutamate--2,6-diaminopimelate ligase
VRLAALIDGVDVVTLMGDDGIDVTAVVHDTASVVEGAMFCCVRGARVDGHDLAPAAVASGATALLCERELATGAVEVVVPSTRAAMGPVAAAFHGHPSLALDVVGVTGTNGKTTTVHLLQSILEAAGRSTGVIGTLTGARTTPEAPELQAQLADMQRAGVAAVAMEVSSHALAMHRVDGTRFAVAVFTNLGRDHLDFHASVEEYFQAKARLFTPELSVQAVVNLDDSYGRLLRDSAVVPTVGFSLDEVQELSIEPTGSRFRWRGTEVHLPLAGRFNVSNAIGAATTAELLGVTADDVAAGLSAVGSVPGRFETVAAGQPFLVVVDYAHTPDGLASLLEAAREVAAGGRVLLVFGAGGDRDRSKRPAMGEVAARAADRVVVTSDNPRSERPDAIIDAIVSGMHERSNVVVEPDRRAAIALALAEARPGDVVVVAGKGHEATQTVGDAVLPFDDRAVVRELLTAGG